MPSVPAHAVIVVLAAVLLACFVVWGTRTDPHRPFSWGMYSGSSKGFLWTRDGDEGGPPRLVGHRELGLSPEAHFMNVPELHRLLTATRPPLSFEGLIIGSQGGWRVQYDGKSGVLKAARVPEGQELDRLVRSLRRLG
ncbi:hypothetical protein [Streptomyces sp. NPDC048650]|uniref:hypothetical protein n=1 Tax=unclassified Streptomyces TaxID=2593676 RepID=UPI0037160E26